MTIGAAFGTSAVSAQSDEAFAVQKSGLTGANLSSGAMQMRKAFDKSAIAPSRAVKSDSIRLKNFLNRCQTIKPNSLKNISLELELIPVYTIY